MAGLNTRIFNGTIHRDGKIVIFTNRGSSSGVCEPLEEFFDNRPNMHLIQILQPDPVRDPSRLRIVVETFNLMDIDFGKAEERVMGYMLHSGNDAADAVAYALGVDPAKRTIPESLCGFPLKTCPSECPRFKRKKTGPTGRVTKPVDQQMFYVRVSKDGFIKFDTKLYSKEKSLIAADDLKQRYRDCVVKVYAEDGNPLK